MSKDQLVFIDTAIVASLLAFIAITADLAYRELVKFRKEREAHARRQAEQTSPGLAAMLNDTVARANAAIARIERNDPRPTPPEGIAIAPTQILPPVRLWPAASPSSGPSARSRARSASARPASHATGSSTCRGGCSPRARSCSTRTRRGWRWSGNRGNTGERR